MRSFQAVYDCPTTSALKDRLDEISDDAAAANLPVTDADLESEIQREFGDLTTIRYSGVVSDESVHCDRADQCDPWMIESQLRAKLEDIVD